MAKWTSGTTWVRKQDQRKVVGRESMSGELGENPICQNHHSIAKAYLYTEPALPVENLGTDGGQRSGGGWSSLQLAFSRFLKALSSSYSSLVPLAPYSPNGIEFFLGIFGVFVDYVVIGVSSPY